MQKADLHGKKPAGVREFRVTCLCCLVLFDAQVHCYAVRARQI